jgi:hypothetical protein
MWARSGAYPRVEHLRGILLGWVPAFPENIKLGLKRSPGTNTLAYYQNSLTMAVESFITLDPGKLFQPSLMFAGKAGAYLSEAPFR